MPREGLERASEPVGWETGQRSSQPVRDMIRRRTHGEQQLRRIRVEELQRPGDGGVEHGVDGAMLDPFGPRVEAAQRPATRRG